VSPRGTFHGDFRPQCQKSSAPDHTSKSINNNTLEVVFVYWADSNDFSGKKSSITKKASPLSSRRSIENAYYELANFNFANYLFPDGVQ
jgi:hypothetical protein